MNEDAFFILSSLGTARRVFGGTRIGFFRTTPLWTSLKTWSCLSPKLGWRVILCSYGVAPAVMLQNANLSPLNLSTTPYFFFHPLLSSFRHALSVKRGSTRPSTASLSIHDGISRVAEHRVILIFVKCHVTYISFWKVSFYVLVISSFFFVENILD